MTTELNAGGGGVEAVEGGIPEARTWREGCGGGIEGHHKPLRPRKE